MNRVFKPIQGVLLISLLAAPAAQAQELQLFEPVEPSGQAPQFGAQAAPDQAQIAMPTSPAFTLVGTSRLGGRHRATLASNTGQIVQVDIEEGRDAPIDGFPGYRLNAMSSRRAEITLPAGMPCVGARDQGVTCGTDGRAYLSLTTAAPVPAAAPAATAETPADPAVAENGDAPENPFAAALRAAAQNEREGNAGRRAFNAERFQPRRIAPEEVPPGMRVVRTPFGDRLVEL